METRVLVVDDHRMFREGLKAVVEQEEGITVVGEAENGREAVALCESLNPDVVVMDIAMPEMGGIAATSTILKSHEDIKVLVLTMHLNETYIAETLKSGASGYVLKDCAVEELVTAIRSVEKGEKYLSPRAASLVVKKLLGEKMEGARSAFDILSTREQEVLQLIVEGKSTRDTAEILFISPKTVENHRANIMRKLDIHDVPSLVRFAIRTGLSEL